MSDEPVLKTLGASTFVVWASRGVTMEFSRIAEHTETVTAEVCILAPIGGEITWQRLNLLAGQARANLAKVCIAAVPDQDWASMIDKACRMVVRSLRAGAPAEALDAKEPEPEWISQRWLVPDLIPRNQITVLYADGGSGKSWLALAIAVSGLLGHPLSPVWTVGPLRRVMYLDWESSRDDHQERLWRLTAGLEQLAPGAILYHRLHRALTDHVDQLATEVARHEVDLVITDSLGASSGPEPESNEAALRTFSALRAIPSTHLVLAHVSKAQADQDGPRRPFGGVYVVNTARSTIEARGEQDDETLTVNLYHRKTNWGRTAKPSALTFSWDRDTGHVRVNAAKAAIGGASLPVQILDALKAGSQTVTALAETLNANEGSVKAKLNDLANRNKVVRLTVTAGGKGNKTQWGLADTNRNSE